MTVCEGMSQSLFSINLWIRPNNQDRLTDKAAYYPARPGESSTKIEGKKVNENILQKDLANGRTCVP